MTVPRTAWTLASVVFWASAAFLMSVMAVAKSQGEPAIAPAWIERLEKLDPRSPLDYFELAEEIADVATDNDELELARHLFALAGLLDTPRLGRSACLARADLEPSEHARRRFKALAWLLDQRAGRVGYLDQRRTEDRSATVASLGTIDAVTEAFSHYRRGYGNRAIAALRRPGAMELMESFDHLIVGGLNRFLEDCRQYRTGDLRPLLSDEQVTGMLRLESALLAGDDRQWTDDLLLYEREPLVEVDPGRLADTFGVDPERAFYRDGQWGTLRSGS